MKGQMVGRKPHASDPVVCMSIPMKRYTYYLDDVLQKRTDKVDGDLDESLEDVHETIAIATSEALRTLARSGWRSGTWTMEAKDERGVSACKITFSAT